jgi:hypothetical protein
MKSNDFYIAYFVFRDVRDVYIIVIHYTPICIGVRLGESIPKWVMNGLDLKRELYSRF